MIARESGVHYVEHGAGRPVLVLHGTGVDHREPEACFEPAFAGLAALRRIYPDLPGMGLTPAPAAVRSADDVLHTLLAFAADVTDGEPSRSSVTPRVPTTHRRWLRARLSRWLVSR